MLSSIALAFFSMCFCSRFAMSESLGSQRHLIVAWGPDLRQTCSRQGIGLLAESQALLSYAVDSVDVVGFDHMKDPSSASIGLMGIEVFGFGADPNHVVLP